VLTIRHFQGLGREGYFITPDTRILMTDNTFKRIVDMEIKKRYEL